MPPSILFTKSAVLKLWLLRPIHMCKHSVILTNFFKDWSCKRKSCTYFEIYWPYLQLGTHNLSILTLLKNLSMCTWGSSYTSTEIFMSFGNRGWKRDNWSSWVLGHLMYKRPNDWFKISEKYCNCSNIQGTRYVLQTCNLWMKHMALSENCTRNRDNWLHLHPMTGTKNRTKWHNKQETESILLLLLDFIFDETVPP